MKRWLLLGMLAVLAVVILCLGVAGGILLDRQVLAVFVPPDSVSQEARSSFELMAEAWNVIQRAYVDRPAVISETLTYGAISGMVDALGDTGHSRFLSPEMVKQQESMTTGEFEGIGAYVGMKDGHVVIVSPMDGSPAQRAGLQPGDIIAKVDGVDVAGLQLDQVVSRILGPAGTEVVLTLTDPDTGETREVRLTRARIKVDNVSWRRLPGTDVAHVRIGAFSQGVTEDLKKALADIQQAGMSGIVLDLRNNPGGLLDEAVGTASQFLASGSVLLQKDAEGNLTPVPVKERGVATKLPLTVLINPGTASASEIVSGALQDAQRAKLVGQTTFGTGTVLSQIPLSDGSALLLATREWLTPLGRVIWHEGIQPDVEVELPEGASPLSPEDAAGLTPEQLRSSGDQQLLKAVDILAGSPGEP